jgi:hypothetical protein
MNRPDRFFIVAACVELGHAHASQTDRRYGQTFRAELPFCHDRFLSMTVTQLVLLAMGLFVVVFAARVFLGRK